MASSLSEKRLPPTAAAADQDQKQRRVNELAEKYVREFETRVVDPTKPFIGAQPRLLRTPEIATEGETNAATRLVCRSLTERIVNAKKGVLVLVAQDASYSMTCRRMLSEASDDEADAAAPSTVVMHDDWSHTFPRTKELYTPPFEDRLIVFIGTPGKYLAMCMHTDLDGFEVAYNSENLVFITLGAVMMPVGSQEQNILGADPHRCIEAVSDALQARGEVAWGHGVGTKLSLLERAFSHLPTTAQWRVRSCERAPEALDVVKMASAKDAVAFDHFAEYIKFSNQLKLAYISPRACVSLSLVFRRDDERPVSLFPPNSRPSCEKRSERGVWMISRRKKCETPLAPQKNNNAGQPRIPRV